MYCTCSSRRTIFLVSWPGATLERASATIGDLFAGATIPTEVASAIALAYASLAGAPNRKAFVRTMRNVIEPGGQAVDATDRLYLAAAVPTLIVWGSHDAIIPVEHGVHAHALIDHSRLEIIDGMGHNLPETLVPRLLELIAVHVGQDGVTSSVAV